MKMNDGLYISFRDCCRSAGVTLAAPGSVLSAGMCFGVTPELPAEGCFSVFVSTLAEPLWLIRDGFHHLVISVTSRARVRSVSRRVKISLRKAAAKVLPEGKSFFTLFNRFRI